MDSIIKKLKKQGNRITGQRRSVLETLSHHPQSAAEVLEVLKSKKIAIDLVTVYRSLDCFANLGVVNKTQFQDQVAKYELIKEGEHHHHVVCNDCGVIEDVHLDESKLFNDIGKKTKFSVLSHNLEFFGLCAKCK